MRKPSLITGLVTTCVAAALPAAGADAAHVSASARGGLDVTRLTLGDGRVTTSGPRRGYVYSCGSMGGMGGAFTAGSWISGSRFDFTKKPTVDGSVSWGRTFSVTRVGSRRRIAGNGLPGHTTGTFPISSSDDAFRYDRNPNRIRSQSVSVAITANPRVNASATCTSGGPVGYMDTGAALFNALDAGSQDAVAHEIQDSCGGHPQPQGAYHYHSIPTCIYAGPSNRHSTRIGWALDGFPIYGPRGSGGKTMRNSALDTCHGHTHTITIDGRRVRSYHYHATLEYPYTVGCFRGTPVRAGGRP